jgi:phosphatidylglycerol:prolipoprotein diacylglycerol transferase
MESIGLLSLCFILVLSLKPFRFRRRPGAVAGFYLFGAGLIRFIVDFFRGDDRGRLIMGEPPTTVVSLAICLAGFLVLLALARSKIDHREAGTNLR